MKQLYAIIAFGGSYEDAWSKAEFITDDEEKGKAYVEKMNAKVVVRAQIKSDIYTWWAEWQRNNPQPPRLSREPVELAVPRWDGKAKVTKEMREERKRIQDANEKERQDAFQPYVDWHRTGHNKWTEWQQATYSAEDLSGILTYDEDITWDLEPIAWLE
jgi:hypothetical protein